MSSAARPQRNPIPAATPGTATEPRMSTRAAGPDNPATPPPPGHGPVAADAGRPGHTITTGPAAAGAGILALTRRRTRAGRRNRNPSGAAGTAGGPSAVAAPSRAAAGTAAGYAAALAAFGYALVSLYWAVGGHGLISTVGGYAGQLARHGGAIPALVALAAALAKAAGGLLALVLVRPWGRVIPRHWRLAGPTAASVLLVAYGGLNVLAGALVLAGVIHPASNPDRTALRWHVAVWDMWFLVWGILLTVATVSHWRRTANQPPGRADQRIRGGPGSVAR